MSTRSAVLMDAPINPAKPPEAVVIASESVHGVLAAAAR
jgi:hypothetical protein